MKGICLNFLFAFAFCFCVIASSNAQDLHTVQSNPDSLGFLVHVGDKAPDFQVQLDNGKLFRLADHKGSLVMLQFTASWCSVCRQEMPFIDSDIWQKYKDKGLVLIGVDRDEPIEKLNILRTQTGITYPLALDSAAVVFGLYADKKSGVTRNVLIDGTGHVVFETRLYNPIEFDALKRKIASYLDTVKEN
jgi:peroxiredoxin